MMEDYIELPLTNGDFVYWVKDNKIYSASRSNYDNTWLEVNPESLKEDLKGLSRINSSTSLELIFKSTREGLIKLIKDETGTQFNYQGIKQLITDQEIKNLMSCLIKSYGLIKKDTKLLPTENLPKLSFD